MREGATNGSDKSHAEGVFDWTQSGQSGAWGDPNQRFRNIQKDIPKTLLAYVSGAFGSLPPLRFPAKFALCLALCRLWRYTIVKCW